MKKYNKVEEKCGKCGKLWEWRAPFGVCYITIYNTIRPNTTDDAQKKEPLKSGSNK